MNKHGRRGAVIVAIVIGIQVAGWGAAIMLSAKHPALLAMCWLAYTLGMRHGLDADHIAAIDNVSRNLIGRGIRPVGLGLYFALGHSSIVTLASLATAGVAMRFSLTLGHFRDGMNACATLISITLLLLVAPRNLIASWQAYQCLRGRRERDHSRQRGILQEWLALRLSRLHVNTWHMFFIGILFGLGFETASAIAVLAMTGAQAAGGATWACILIFPLLFTAGMALVDAIDAIFMEFAYSWAIQWPRKQAIYNLSVTGFSAAAALFVGSLELVSLVQTPGNGWSIVSQVESHFDMLGATIALTLATIWLVARLTQLGCGRIKMPQSQFHSPGSISNDVT